MYAIFRTGGKQYRVQPGDVIRVEKLEHALGAQFDITDVLMIGGNTAVVGQPLVKDAKITVVVTKQTKDRKVIIFKKKRRQGYRRFKTHRQPFTELFVMSIAHGGEVAKTDQEANVVDVDKSRLERIQQKVADRKERASQRVSASDDTESAAPKKAAKAKKKVAKKAAPAKKKVAKKATGAKKKTAKKKTTKK